MLALGGVVGVNGPVICSDSFNHCIVPCDVADVALNTSCITRKVLYRVFQKKETKIKMLFPRELLNIKKKKVATIYYVMVSSFY